MSQTLNAAIAVVGIDIGKNSWWATMSVVRLYCVRSGRVARSRPALPTYRRA
jgi:hypothetical protein